MRQHAPTQPIRHRRAVPVAGLLFLIGAAGSGCANPPRTWSFVPPLFRSASAALPARPALAIVEPPRSDGSPAAALIERSLRDRGLRFGTDGSMGALYEYLRGRHRAVAARQARPGDIVFFELEVGRSWGCGAHGGVVDKVDPVGRITFREWRDGGVRRSYLDPGAPRARRDASGRIINSFLRVKRPHDEASARYFAGELLCAVIRPGAK